MAMRATHISIALAIVVLLAHSLREETNAKLDVDTHVTAPTEGRAIPREGCDPIEHPGDRANKESCWRRRYDPERSLNADPKCSCSECEIIGFAMRRHFGIVIGDDAGTETASGRPWTIPDGWLKEDFLKRRAPYEETMNAKTVHALEMMLNEPWNHSSSRQYWLKELANVGCTCAWQFDPKADLFAFAWHHVNQPSEEVQFPVTTYRKGHKLPQKSEFKGYSWQKAQIPLFCALSAFPRFGATRNQIIKMKTSLWETIMKAERGAKAPLYHSGVKATSPEFIRNFAFDVDDPGAYNGCLSCLTDKDKCCLTDKDNVPSQAP